MKPRGILALEELDESRVDAPVEQEVREEELVADAPETEAVAEVEETHDGVIEATDASEEATETADTIEEVRDNVAEAIETEGGVSEPEARALDVAVEHMLVRLGAPRKTAKVFPAMEGFKDKATRAQSSKIALEAMDGKIKKIWEAIVAQIMKIYEAIVAFVRSLLSAGKLLEMRAARMIKAAAAKKDHKPTEISVGRWGQGVLVDGKFPNGAELVKGIQGLAGDKYINHNYGHSVSEANKIVVKMLELVGKPDAKDELHKLMAELDTSIGLDVPQSYALPMGGATLVVEKKIEDGNIVSASVKISAGDAKAPEKAEGMSAEEVGKVAQAVQADLKKFSGYEKEAGDMAAALKGLVAQVKSKVGKASDEQKDANATVQAVARVVSAEKSLIASMSTKLRAYNLQSLKAALDFGAASLSGSSKPEKAKEGAAPATAAAA